MLTSLKELHLGVHTVIEKVPHLGRVWGLGAAQDLFHGFQALLLQLQHGLPQRAALLLRKDTAMQKSTRYGRGHWQPRVQLLTAPCTPSSVPKPPLPGLL